MADELLGQQLLRHDLKDVHGGGVGGDDDVGPHTGGQLLVQGDLGVPVLHNGFLDEVGAGHRLLYGHGKGDPGVDGLHVLRLDLALLGEGVQLGAQGGLGLLPGGLRPGPHGHLIAAHGVHLGDAGAHGTGAQHCDLLDVLQCFHNLNTSKNLSSCKDCVLGGVQRLAPLGMCFSRPHFEGNSKGAALDCFKDCVLEGFSKRFALGDVFSRPHFF